MLRCRELRTAVVANKRLFMFGAGDNQRHLGDRANLATAKPSLSQVVRSGAFRHLLFFGTFRNNNSFIRVRLHMKEENP
jgi:hypothetical protein